MDLAQGTESGLLGDNAAGQTLDPQCEDGGFYQARGAWSHTQSFWACLLWEEPVRSTAPESRWVEGDVSVLLFPVVSPVSCHLPGP